VARLSSKEFFEVTRTVRPRKFSDEAILAALRASSSVAAAAKLLGAFVTTLYKRGDTGALATAYLDCSARGKSSRKRNLRVGPSMARRKRNADADIIVALEAAFSATHAAKLLGVSRPALKIRCAGSAELRAAYDRCAARGMQNCGQRGQALSRRAA
jgi:hypothetical protein